MRPGRLSRVLPEKPTLDELLLGFHVVSIPLKVPFRGLRFREVAIFQGPHGFAEWAAFREYPDAQAAWWLVTALEQYLGITASEADAPVPVSAIVPSMPIEMIQNWWEQFEGCRAVKLKVAEKAELFNEDLARVAEVRRVAGSNVSLRVDANAAWSVQQAANAIEALAEWNVDYVEQPVASLSELADLKKRVASQSVRLAADEIIRKNHSIEGLASAGCEVLVLKPSPLGGFERTIRLVKSALNQNLEVVISSGLETSIGLHHVLAVAREASKLSNTTTPHGLGTAVLFKREPAGNPLAPRNGFLASEPLEISRESMSRLSASDATVREWKERLTRCLPIALQLMEI